jgi:hypothetical protein
MMEERSLKLSRVSRSGSLICVERNTGMWHSVACHEFSRRDDGVALEAADLVRIHSERDCHTRSD